MSRESQRLIEVAALLGTRLNSAVKDVIPPEAQAHFATAGREFAAGVQATVEHHLGRGRGERQGPTRIEIDELHALVGGEAQLVEVLPAEEYREEHLPGAISIPLKELDTQTTAGLDKGHPIIVYCWDYL